MLEDTATNKIEISSSNPQMELRLRRLEYAFLELSRIKEKRLQAAEKAIETLTAQNNMLKDGIQALHIKLSGFEVPAIDDIGKSEEISYAEGYLNLCFPPTMTTGRNLDGTCVC